jgi:hypothetical protein
MTLQIVNIELKSKGKNVFAQLQLSDGAYSINCAVVRKLGEIISSVLTEFAVINVDIGKQQLSWMKDRPFLIMNHEPVKLVARCTKLIGHPQLCKGGVESLKVT